MKTTTINSLFISCVLFAVTVLSSCDNDDKAPVNDPARKEYVKKALDFREDLNFINRFVDKNVIEIPSDGGRTSFARSIIGRVKNSAPCVDAIEEEQPDGSFKITLDFGDGCQTEDDTEVAGKVIMIFTFAENLLEYALEFIDYKELSGENQGETINGTVNGSFGIDLEAGKFNQQMEQDIVVTYPNNTEAIYKMLQVSQLTEAGLEVSSLTTTGNFADGGAFTLTLRKTLVFDFSCENDLPVRGEEVLTFQGNTIVVNYGDGTCDDDYTVN